MIKRWSTFNENSDNIKQILLDKLTEVREVFLDIEDMSIISYSVIVSGFERGGYIQFDPKRGNFDTFIENMTTSVKFMLTQRGHKSVDKDLCIIADIKLPGESNEFGSTVIGNEGIKVFEDILVANSRLIDSGYDVKLDLNASHGQYKPVKFLIYFNL